MLSSKIPEEKNKKRNLHDLEEVLHESEEKFKVLATNTPDHVLIQDKNLRYTFVLNPQLGLTEKDMIGKKDKDILSKEDAAALTKIKKKVLATGEPKFVTVPLFSLSGGKEYFEGTYVPKRESQGRIDGIIGYFRNVTERTRLEEALAKARNELGIKVEERTKELNRINKDLKKSEEKYSNLVEKGNDGIVIIQDGVLKFVNPIIAKMTGLPKEEAIGRPFTDFVAPEYRQLVIDRYKKRLKGEKVQQKYEIEILANDGDKIPVEINASVIEHEGRPADMAIIRDVTDRKETENRLAAEKKKMDAIFNTTAEGLALYDHDGRIVDVNPAFEKLFGFKKKAIGVPRMEIIRNRDKFYKYKVERDDEPEETQRNVYSGKSVSHVLLKIHSRPAKFLEGNYVPIRDVQRRVIGMSSSFRDVTALKNQAEKIAQQLTEVDRQKNRWQAIFENVEEGILIIDKELRTISVNSAFELMTDSTQAEMVGKKYYEILGCHDRFGHYYPEFNPISKVLATREAVPYDEHLHTSKSGQERWVGVSYTPIFNEEGQIEQIVSVIRDITAIKEVERAKSEFVSVASHELRTPLTVVNGYLSLLLGGDLGKLSDPNSQERFQAVFEKLYNETNRLTKMVEDLLNVSRIEDGRIKLVLRKVSLLETIDEVVKEFKVLAAERNIKLSVKNNLGEESDRLFVTADKDKLKQILVNLIDNALKYTKGGGKVSVGCFLKNGQLYTQVKDTGVGIPASVLPRIFEKFQQGSSGSYLKENKGTGLGLFVVKSLVELQSGKIWVDSKAGKGTKFTFTLPPVAAS